MTLPEPGRRVLLPLVSLITYNGEAYAQPLRTDICDRTSQMQTAILAAVPFTVACGQAPQASLAGITSLDLSGQSISALASGDFAGLTGLTTLSLGRNSLTTLPEEVFEGLSDLTTLNLGFNFDLTLPMSGDRVLHNLVSLATYNGAAYTQPIRGICDRTEEVQTAILAAFQVTTTDCAAVDEAELAKITSLNLSNKSISALASGDFAGLTGLTTLSLGRNSLTTPDDVFDPLSSLIVVNLQSNQLTALPADVFDGLTSLTHLRLGANDLTTLPADVFDDLTGLTTLDLSDNNLSSLPETVFDDLAALTELDLRNNASLTLPEPGHRVLRYLVSLTTYNGEPYVSPDVSEPPGQDFPDDATTPGKLSVGGSVTGAIKDIEDTPDPADAFLVTPTPGTTYVVDLEGAAAIQGALYYSFLEVYTLNPTLVDSDGGPGRNAQVEFEAKSPGKYRIRVSSKLGSTVTYRLSLDEKRDPPGAPPAPSLLSYDSSLIVSWTAPSDDGNSPVTSYDLRHIPSGSPDKADANWTVIDPAWESGRLRYEITGLTNDTEYDVQVRAVNAKGDGAWSETATGAPEELVGQMGNWCDRATIRTLPRYCDLDKTGRLAVGVVSRGEIGEEGGLGGQRLVPVNAGRGQDVPHRRLGSPQRRRHPRRPPLQGHARRIPGGGDRWRASIHPPARRPPGRSRRQGRERVASVGAARRARRGAIVRLPIQRRRRAGLERAALPAGVRAGRVLRGGVGRELRGHLPADHDRGGGRRPGHTLPHGGRLGQRRAGLRQGRGRFPGGAGCGHGVRGPAQGHRLAQYLL